MLHFGLGSATAVERIHVHWPDGLEAEYSEVPADRLVVLRRGEATAEIRPLRP